MTAKLMLPLKKLRMLLLREPRKSKRLPAKMVAKVERNPLTEKEVREVKMEKTVKVEKMMVVKTEKKVAKTAANYEDCLELSKIYI